MTIENQSQTAFIDFIAQYHAASSAVNAKLSPHRHDQTRPDNRCKNCDEKSDERRCLDCPRILLPKLCVVENYVKAAQEILWLLNRREQEMLAGHQEIIDQG